MKLFWPVYMAQMLILAVFAFNAFVCRSTPSIVADAVFALRETAIAAKEYWANILNYAVYKELSKNFPGEYADDREERWNVPSWFKNPKGGTTVYCTEIGCTVWNLTDAGDPCPDVVSPNLPDPKQELQNVSRASVLSRAAEYAEEASSRLTEALRRASWGDVSIAPWDVNVSPTASGVDVEGEARITVRIPADVSITYTSSQKFVARISVKYKKVEASCVCKNKSTGRDETLATYELNRALLHFVTEDPNTGDVATDRTVLYVQWFLPKRTRKKSVDPDNYESCRMELP